MPPPQSKLLSFLMGVTLATTVFSFHPFLSVFKHFLCCSLSSPFKTNTHTHTHTHKVHVIPCLLSVISHHSQNKTLNVVARILWSGSAVPSHIMSSLSLCSSHLDFLPVLTLARWVLPLTLGHFVHFVIDTWNLLAFSIFLENSSLFFRTQLMLHVLKELLQLCQIHLLWGLSNLYLFIACINELIYSIKRYYTFIMCSSFIQATRIYSQANKTEIPAFIQFTFQWKEKSHKQRSK